MAGVKRGRTATSTNLVDLQTEVLEKELKNAQRMSTSLERFDAFINR